MTSRFATLLFFAFMIGCGRPISKTNPDKDATAQTDASLTLPTASESADEQAARHIRMLELVKQVEMKEAVLSVVWKKYDLAEHPKWQEVTVEKSPTGWRVTGDVLFEEKRHTIVAECSLDGEVIDAVSDSPEFMTRGVRVRIRAEAEETSTKEAAALEFLKGKYELPSDTKWAWRSVTPDRGVVGGIVLNGVYCEVTSGKIITPTDVELATNAVQRAAQLEKVKVMTTEWEKHNNGTTRDVRRVVDSPNVQVVQLYPVFANAHDERITALAVSPSGLLLATGCMDTSVKIHGLNEEGPTTLAGHQNPVEALLFSPNGTMLISGSRRLGGISAPSVIEWKVSTGEMMREFSKKAPPPLDVETNADLLTTNSSESQQLQSLGQSLSELANGIPLESVHEVAYSPDGSQFLVEDSQGFLRWSDEVKNQSPGLQFVAARKDRNGSGFIYSADGKSFTYCDGAQVASGVDVVVKRFDNEGDKETRFPLVKTNGEVVFRVSPYSPSNLLVASGWCHPDKFGWVIVMDLTHGEKRVLQREGVGIGCSSMLSADGTTVAVEVGSSVELWNLETARVTHRFENAAMPVFFSDGKQLAMVYQEKSIAIVSLDKAE